MEARLAPTADSHQPPELLVHVEGCFEKPPPLSLPGDFRVSHRSVQGGEAQRKGFDILTLPLQDAGWDRTRALGWLELVQLCFTSLPARSGRDLGKVLAL